MRRTYPNARRGTALSLLASLALLLAAESGASFMATPAQAETTSTTPGRRPMPGDPNTPDEGGRSTSLSATTVKVKPVSWFELWLRGISHFTFIAR
jgi:hypothetical protein